MMQDRVVLGLFISPKGIEVDLAKIEVIRTFSIPAKLKEVRSFLGHARYYRHFIKDFSQIAAPHTNFFEKMLILYGILIIQRPSYNLRKSSQQHQFSED